MGVRGLDKCNMCSSSTHWEGMETAIPQHPLLHIMISKYQFCLEEMMDSRALLAKVENEPRTAS